VVSANCRLAATPARGSAANPSRQRSTSHGPAELRGARAAAAVVSLACNRRTPPATSRRSVPSGAGSPRNPIRVAVRPGRPPGADAPHRARSPPLPTSMPGAPPTRRSSYSCRIAGAEDMFPRNTKTRTTTQAQAETELQLLVVAGRPGQSGRSTGSPRPAGAKK